VERADRERAVLGALLAERDPVTHFQIGQRDLLAGARDLHLVGDLDRPLPSVVRLEREL
jgi:hypothetical protein